MKDSDLQLEDILTDKVVEEDLVAVPLADRMFKIFSGVAFLVVILIFARVGFFTFLEREYYTVRALENMSDAKVIPAPRGLITDRFGTSLVSNVPSFNVFLLPRFLPSASEGRSVELQRIGALLHLDADTIREQTVRKDWNLSDKPETSSVFVPGSGVRQEWNNLTPSGEWIIKQFGK